MNFGRAERVRYRKYFVPIYGQFLQKCYCKFLPFIPTFTVLKSRVGSGRRMSSTSAACCGGFRGLGDHGFRG
jgi:hypothetical protein